MAVFGVGDEITIGMRVDKGLFCEPIYISNSSDTSTSSLSNMALPFIVGDGAAIGVHAGMYSFYNPFPLPPPPIVSVPIWFYNEDGAPYDKDEDAKMWRDEDEAWVKWRKECNKIDKLK